MTSETQGDGRATNPSGLYRHKETGEELVAIETSKFGNPQADAYVRQGYERVGDVPKSTPAQVDPHAAPLATPMGVKTSTELRSELAEAEKREAEQAASRKEAVKTESTADNSGELAKLKAQLAKSEKARKDAEAKATQAEKNADEALKLAQEQEFKPNAVTPKENK